MRNVLFTYDFSEYFAGEIIKCNIVRASIVEVSPRFLIAQKKSNRVLNYLTFYEVLLYLRPADNEIFI